MVNEAQQDVEEARTVDVVEEETVEEDEVEVTLVRKRITHRSYVSTARRRVTSNLCVLRRKKRNKS